VSAKANPVQKEIEYYFCRNFSLISCTDKKNMQLTLVLFYPTVILHAMVNSVLSFVFF